MQSRKLSTLELELGFFSTSKKSQRTPGSLPNPTAAHNMPERLGQGFMSFWMFAANSSKNKNFSAKSNMGPEPFVLQS